MTRAVSGVNCQGQALITQFGWRVMFVICGAGGLAWLLGWLLLANDDKTVPRVSRAAADADELTFRDMLASPVMWGIILGTFAYGYFLYFCVTWLPAAPPI